MEERNETVDALRALAALAVCFFHFTRFEHFQAVSMLGRACNYGALGIEVIALGARWPASAWLELILVLVAFALSIGVAYLLYVSVERPSRMLSGRIHYAR